MATAAAVQDEATAHRFAKDHLKAFVERVERLEEEKKALSDDIRDVYAEAKGERLRRQGVAAGGAAAQAGHGRAQGAGSDPGDVSAGARDVELTHVMPGRVPGIHAFACIKRRDGWAKGRSRPCSAGYARAKNTSAQA